jgi:hypothetical protein
MKKFLLLSLILFVGISPVLAFVFLDGVINGNSVLISLFVSCLVYVFCFCVQTFIFVFTKLFNLLERVTNENR